MDDYSNIMIDPFDLTLISARQKGGVFIIIRVCTILVLLAPKKGQSGYPCVNY